MKQIESEITYMIVEVTPADAENLLASSPGNRIVSRKRVLQYAAIMKAGNWELNGQPIIIDSEGRLADGHGRCCACIEANVPFTTVLVANVPRQTWITLDSGKIRSGGDTFEIEGITNGILKNAIVSKYHALTMGLVAASDSGSMNVVGADFKAQALVLYRHHTDIFDWATTISVSAVTKGLRGICVASILGGIASYLVLTKEVDRDTVEHFFDSLVSNYSPLFVSTRTRLKETSKGSIRQAILADAWEKFIAGRESVIIKITASKKF